jgi:hypothetical protein
MEQVEPVAKGVVFLTQTRDEERSVVLGEDSVRSRETAEGDDQFRRRLFAFGCRLRHRPCGKSQGRKYAKVHCLALRGSVATDRRTTACRGESFE